MGLFTIAGISQRLNSVVNVTQRKNESGTINTDGLHLRNDTKKRTQAT